MRCFVALDLPESVRAVLVRAVDELRGPDAAVRWVAAENLHVTLKFLGDSSDEQVAEMTAAVESLPDEKLELVLSGLGQFPPRGRPRVFWAGLEGAIEAIARIARSLEHAARQCGFPRERRPFRAHVTLGRVKGGHGLRALEPLLATVGSTLDSDPFQAPSITLYRSELTPSGARYTAVARRVLGT